MEISLFCFHALPFVILFLHPFPSTADSAPANVTDFSNVPISTAPCDAYVVYRAQLPEFMDLGNVSDLFGVSRLAIQSASNLSSEEVGLPPGQLLLIPISCGCTGNGSFANITYEIKFGDSFYFVSIHAFENLTDFNTVEALNPTLVASDLHAGDKVIFPIYCKCPTETQLKRGIKFIITYVWQPSDDFVSVSELLNATVDDVEAENNYLNFSDAVNHPVFVPVSELPVLPRVSSLPVIIRNTSHRKLDIVLPSVGSLIILWALFGIYYWKRFQGKATDVRESLPSCSIKESRLEKLNLIQLKKGVKDETSSPKAQNKLLPGVSGYLGKTTIYEMKTIMESTMNLSERYRIGRSTYQAMIKGQFFAVKKGNENVREELNILQKLNHANLVKLVGISTDVDGGCFLVYEFAENGSLDKWLHRKSFPSSSMSSLSFLSWRKRVNLALDVASGLQYMHEHTSPSVVHRDVRTTNILLNSHFKAKIAKFSMAKPVVDAMLLKVDVYAFGIILLELITGRKAMETREDGEIVMLWKEVRLILESEEKKEARLRKWMDPSLQDLYPITGAMHLASIARACTWDKPSARPCMGEIVFSISVLTQSSSDTFEKDWTSGIEADDSVEIISPINAR
ncbi:hypothetical protein ACLOJK_002901 [Asimina triloba]